MDTIIDLFTEHTAAMILAILGLIVFLKVRKAVHFVVKLAILAFIVLVLIISFM